jgi:hypothetical protein
MKYYVLEIQADVEPFLHGAYQSEERRDSQARELRANDYDERNGLFWLNVTAGRDATVGFYSHAELDDIP